jgi:hypothetical protein
MMQYHFSKSVCILLLAATVTVAQDAPAPTPLSSKLS